MQKILVLDQALANTGICFSSSQSHNRLYFYSDTIKTTNKNTEQERLKILVDEIDRLILVYTPDVIILEEIFCPRGLPGAWNQLIKVQELIVQLCIYNNVTYSFLSPLKNRKNSWRKVLQLESNKKKSKEYLLKIDPNMKLNEHSADAACMLLAYLSYQNKVSIPLTHLIQLKGKLI